MDDELRPMTERYGNVTFPASWGPGARSRLMAAMALAVARRGLVETRVEDALGLAGASRRTFYECFENREACFFAAYDAIGADVRAILHRHRTGLERGLRGVLEYFAAWPAHGRLVTYEILAGGRAGLARHEASMAELARWLGPHLRDARGVGISADDGRQAAVGALHRIVLHRLVADDDAALPGLAPALAALVDGTSR